MMLYSREPKWKTPVVILVMLCLILQRTPNSGETYILGSLRSRGIRIQRWRVRQSLQEIDPVGRSFRRRRAIRRRVYSVQTPNQLWHIDGNHKLVRWRLVFHGRGTELWIAIQGQV
ncbi:hypothetical protein F2P79_008969 [Pimephales promelas]|nr:hypothetical protein F2P79_008969 [Pimephales promelas]